MTVQTPKKRNPIINLILFILTLCTVFLAGLLHFHATTFEQRLQNGFIFVASLMGILVAHEAGHYVMAKKNNVDASLPYFIPIPPIVSLFGTMGAVIVMRGRIKSRDALMEVGAAGPLAGMMVAIPILFIGLTQCPIIKLEGGYMEGQSLLYTFAKYIIIGHIPEGHDILIDRSPMAFAGWFGLLITMLNMLPIGQLDGGHIFYALFGEFHSKVSILFHRLLFLLGLGVGCYYGLDAYNRGLPTDIIIEAASPGFSWVFLGIVMFLLFRKRGFHHPPTDDNTLSSRGKAMGITCLIIFVITFMPTVMRPIV